MKKLLLAACLSALALSPVHADECGPLKRIAALDMLPSSGNRVIVPAAIGETPLKMIVDTGGYYTMLTENKAAELGLPIDVRPASRVLMFGGHVIRRFASAPDFRLGRLKAGRFDYPLLPPGFLEPDIDGLLSPDYLANYDVDFDFAGGKLNLFSRDHCEGRVGYWTDKAPLGIPIHRDEDGVHIFIDLQIDGRPIKAVIDTGAVRSVASLEEVESLLGVKDDDPRFKKLPAGPNKISTARRFPIQKLTFGAVEVNNPDIILVPENDMHMGPRQPRMLLGLSVLRQLHLYIAYREKMIYVTPASEHK